LKKPTFPLAPTVVEAFEGIVVASFVVVAFVAVAWGFAFANDLAYSYYNTYYTPHYIYIIT
jgi:hypothetical protein